jgi:regulator of replication initiation timing
MTEPSEHIIQQLHIEIMRASEIVNQTAAEVKDMQGELVVLKAELAARGDKIRELMEWNDLLAEENRQLRRRLSDANFELRRMHNGDL